MQTSSGEMEEDEVYILPPEEVGEIKPSRRVLRSSCVGTKCLCASKGLKHHHEPSDNMHATVEKDEEAAIEKDDEDVQIIESKSLQTSSALPSSIKGWTSSRSSYTATTSSSTRIVKSFSSTSTSESSRVFLQTQHPRYSVSSTSSFISPTIGTSTSSFVSPTSTSSLYSSVRRESRSGGGDSRGSYLSSSLKSPSHEGASKFSISSYLSQQEHADRDSKKLAYRESSFIKDVSPDTSSFSDSLDSPRHRIFRDFDNWINSPRTGYTYAESETYGSETESKYEVPMPHMARNPIHRGGPHKSLKSVSFRVKQSEQKSSLFISIKRLFRKVFYEIPASFLIFDTKLLLKSPKNMIASTLLYLWTILVVSPAKFVQTCVSNVIYLPATMIKKFKEMFSRDEKIEVREIAENKEKPLSTISFRSLAKLRQSLALASKRYRLKKLKEKVPKVYGKRNKSHSQPTRRSRRLRGIPAEKYELPKKWKRRMKKRKNAIKTMKAEDNHVFSDAWYSFLSLFSLSSYMEDDSDSDSSDSESDSDSPVIKNSQLLHGSKPMTNKLFYYLAYLLSYLRKPFDYLGSSYHRFRMSLAKRIYYYFDHEYSKSNFSDSDSEDEEEDVDDHDDDIEEFMESRYLIQDIVTYLISLARPPPISNRNTRKTSHQFVYSKPQTERSKIVRHKYKGKVPGRTAEISDTEDSNEEEAPFTKIGSPTNVNPSIRSRIRRRVSNLFTNFSKNGSSNKVEKRNTPGIVLSSDEDVVSVIQVPKLYSDTKKSSKFKVRADEGLEESSSWSSWLLALILYPWNLIKSAFSALMNESSVSSADAFKGKSTTSYENQLESSQKSLFHRIGGSIYNFIRNLGLLIGSLCIYMVLPVIHGSRKVMSLFSSEDEVDDLVGAEFSEDEYHDEGFDSLSDEELEKKVLDSNMKLFSSQMTSIQGKSKRKRGGSGCLRLAPFLLLLLLVPLFFYGLWPAMSSGSEEGLITPMDWIATKSHAYLNDAKAIQNKVQEKGISAWRYLNNGFGTFVSSGIPNLKNSTLSIINNVSGGLSNYESHLMKYISGLWSKMSDLFGYLKDGCIHVSQSTWSLMQDLWRWIRETFLYCFEKLKEVSLQTGALMTQGGVSVKNKAMLVPLFFSTQWERVGNWLSSGSRVQNKDGLSPTPTLKQESYTSVKSSLLSSADYDIIVEKIISNGKFQELAKQGSFFEGENDEVIKSSKSEFIKIVNDQEEKLQKDYNELKDLLLQQKESLDSHQESYESWKKDIDNIFQNLKMEIEGLSGKTEEDKGSMHLLKELQDKIVALEEKSLKLFNLSSTCCESISSLDIQSRVKDYFSDSKGEELLLWMKERFISKDENSNRLSNLKKDIMSRLDSLQVSNDGSSSPLPIESVHRVVQEALIRYDADKTGKFDYALESAGGSVISTRCTETYVKKTALYTLLGLPLWYPSNNPRTAIQPGVHPGECWAFKGSEGYLVIHLSNAIIPQSFSIEHIPKSMSPTGNIDSAPKDFVVLGLKTEMDPEPVHLGKYSYSNSGDPLQSFDVQNPVDDSFDIIELNILSNHGNVNFTCLYRFRVHGSPVHH